MQLQNEEMTEQELETEKKNLIEELGVHMEGQNLAPLAARIMATLILTGKKGMTFDELVNNLQAGKSSISTHLDQLQLTNRVKYFTKPGDRKRYFIIDPNLILNIMEEMIVKWENEKLLHTRILDYKKKCNELCHESDGYEFDLEFQEDFLTFLEETSAAVKKFKSKLIARNN